MAKSTSHGKKVGRGIRKNKRYVLEGRREKNKDKKRKKQQNFEEKKKMKKELNSEVNKTKSRDND